MKRPIVREAAARADLAAIAYYLAERSPQAADRFLKAAERTVDLLASRPGLGMPYDLDHPRYADIRLCPVTRFRSYLIVYRVAEDRVEILRVLHGARDIDSVLADELAPDEP